MIHALDQARLVVEALVQSGVTDFVVSPGARNAPLFAAALEQAAVSVHPVVDERSAGFFALGIGRVQGRAAALVCTSGTAGAHYLPAVVEAYAARVPLLVITADRPPERHGRGANQTIDQRHLFGTHLRQFTDLGPPSEAAVPGVMSSVSRTVFATRWPSPGPAHLNVPLRKPLHPGGERSAAAKVALSRGAPTFTAPKCTPDPAMIRRLADQIRSTERGVVVAGPAPLRTDPTAAFALSRASGFPLFAEPASQLRLTGRSEEGRCDHYEFMASPKPALVVQLGGAPTSAALQALLAQADRHLILCEGDFPDPGFGANHVVLGPVEESCRALCDALGADRTKTDWWQAVVRADEAAGATCAASVHAGGWSEAAVARTTAASVPPDGLFMVGNSLPIRTVEAFVPGDLVRAGVLSQRGASGIDGLVAGALGAATGSGRAVTLLLGDQSFAHDAASLALATALTVPVRIVVVHNDGGRIFERLSLPAAEQVVMPHGRSFEGLAGHYGVRFEAAEDLRTLARVLQDRSPGCLVVEARLPPTTLALPPLEASP